MKILKFFLFALLLLQTSPLLFANGNYPAPSDIVKAYFAAVDAGNSTEVANILADDCWASAPFLPQPVPKQSWMGVVQGLKGAFPDMKHEVVEFIESGFKVAVRGIATGQNNGPFMGNPASGNRINLPFNTIFELDRSWKIKAIYVQFDQKVLEAQLMAGLPDPVAAVEAGIRAMIAAADAGEAEKFMGYWADGAANYFAGKQTSGEDMKSRILGLKSAFPDIKRNLDEVTVCGNSATVRGWVTGTNTGPFRGQAPTGRAIRIAWLGLYKLNADGKIESGWVEFDTAALTNQVNGDLSGK